MHFTRDSVGWSKGEWLVASQGSVSGGYGNAVAVDGDRVAVADTGHPDTDSSTMVYVFEPTGTQWEQAAALNLGPQVATMDIALRGGTLAVTLEPWSSENPCQAMVFERGSDGWEQVLTLELADGYNPHLALGEDLLVIASYSWLEQGAQAIVLTREGSSWEEVATLVPSIQSQYQTSVSVAADGRRFAVGVHGSSRDGPVTLYRVE